MQNNKTGLQFGDALTIAFIVLKLTGVIDWSWVWVLAPIWVSFILVIVIEIITAICNKK